MPAFYRASLAEFLGEHPDRVIGALATASAGLGFADLRQKQAKAWQKQIGLLRSAGSTLISQFPQAANWFLLLEYPIPRRQKRIDAILLAADLVFCMEFKTEGKAHTLQAQQQVEDYAIDLRDFHEQSRGRLIIPLAVACNAQSAEGRAAAPSDGLVRPVVLATGNDLAHQIASVFSAESRPAGATTDADAWDSSAYRPVPTIIEAAEALFAGHNVREIVHSYAGATNLTRTSQKLLETIQRAQRQRQKVACFVTGVPGAGKTLAGLNLVHNPALRQQDRPSSVFLSGNGPLVRIVRAAIARDFRRRTASAGGERTVRTFIQNVHEFVRDALDKPGSPPHENVIVFDEAQRAWDAAHNAKKTGSRLSEPETVLSIMDRHADWAVIVALVGGGQEIHDGEAGLAEWGRSLRDRFPHWGVEAPAEALVGDACSAGQCLFAGGASGGLQVVEQPDLHLKVSERSFRARRLTEWVEAVLAGDPTAASAIVCDLRGFPLVLTRSLAKARAWLMQHTRGLRRCGLLASSGAIRLRAEGLELSSGFRRGNRDLYVNWFLAEPHDVRSSNRLEVAASEFECQGLELDWSGVCWAGDFTFDAASRAWTFRRFSPSRWLDVASDVRRRYLLNTYRVLLTRAREGMILWIPTGDRADETRAPEPFDATAAYLGRCGVAEI